MKSRCPVHHGLAVLLLLCVLAKYGTAAEKPMNVLMLVSDDLNSWLLENPERYTGKVIAPNLKALGESGVNFKYAYTAAPVCSPSRTAFFSWVAPWKSGVYNNAQTNNKSEALNRDAVVSLAGLFKKAADRPNIIFILADDLGYGDLVCYSSDNGSSSGPGSEPASDLREWWSSFRGSHC